MGKSNIGIYIVLSIIILGAGFFGLQANSQGAKQRIENVNEKDTTGYLEYSQENFISSRSKGDSVLFFAATTWCQSCSALDEEIVERSSEIPKNITILKVDYDKDREMNGKYGVTTQHTLIVLNNKGEEVERWIGGGFDTLLQQVNEI